MNKLLHIIKKQGKTAVWATVLVLIIVFSVFFASCRKANNDGGYGSTAESDQLDLSAQSSDYTSAGGSSGVNSSSSGGTAGDDNSLNGSSTTDSPESSGVSSGGSGSSVLVGTQSGSAGGTQYVSSGNTDSSHKHIWKSHTAQKKVTETVTVVDEPEMTVGYSLYRMYWYNTGEWEETRDPERFQTWMRDREGGQISPDSITMAKNPEDCPLFKGYDENGHASFTNDHTIISGLYETIPAVTHEETRTRYETYTDYYYCDCGAVKK